ncbi:hypothetical protein MPL3365_100204 [Mesorhizobium plurifarium]|uniref:Uncharacterized protein n=1 Tax=Mesorhizobium plurifarium TaxID=69974 RepID=A0A090G0U3_MESPL|nr:hypothetical protein MPL3365_100204 [Mesorhizobium plurifarium]
MKAKKNRPVWPGGRLVQSEQFREKCVTFRFGDFAVTFRPELRKNKEIEHETETREAVFGRHHGHPALAVLDLLDRLRHQLVHGAADLMVGLVDAGGIEILADLAENIVVARFLDIGDHNFLGIGLGIGAGFAEFLGGPQAKRLVAARRGLEAKFLVEGEFALEALFAVFHAAHDVPPINPIRLAVNMCDGQAQTKRPRAGQYGSWHAALRHFGSESG